MMTLVTPFKHVSKLIGILIVVLQVDTVLAYNWERSNQQSTTRIDNSKWQRFLDQHLISDEKSKINLLKYAQVEQSARIDLIDYIHQLRQVNPTELNKKEQMAYWINLYNALTVKLILENYPTKSIKKLGKGFFSFGPWDDDIIKINGEVLSLNDIEHEILRPIFKDKRIHYAVNCASIGCPNLSAQAYSAAKLEAQLDQAACDYINHERGVSVESETLTLSSIYKWYADDFGSQKELINHILDCAQPILKRKLQTWIDSGNDDIDYHYDWSLNEYRGP